MIKQISKSTADAFVQQHYPPQTCSTDWSALPPELLRDILMRVEDSQEGQQQRRHVVAAAGVCRAWRTFIRNSKRSQFLEPGSLMMFPGHLKQSLPMGSPTVECYIIRNKRTGVLALYLGANPTVPGAGKLLLAAKRVGWLPTNSEYVISLSPRNFRQSSATFAGRLRGNFLGNKYTVYDADRKEQVACWGNKSAKRHPLPETPVACEKGMRPVSTAKTLPTRTAQPAPVVTVCYSINLIGERGPRRMKCCLLRPASTPPACAKAASLPGVDGTAMSEGSGCPKSTCCHGPAERTVLESKPPQWRESMQSWCLNFGDRVTAASVKNFQLEDSAAPESAEKPILLQFGKLGRNLFSMDFGYPLSAFQAFAICLSSFDSQFACE